MSDVKWTPSQQAAIEARDAKVLVNAAAGSGKTAVLTERIIKRLVPDNGEVPARADRLLVVTFTRAAAAEMRDRIERGLKEELAKAAASGDMKRRRFVSGQIKQLAAAKISTIDSFCQTLVKEYFHILDIDPAFSIVQGTEEDVIKSEVFAALQDRLYEEKDKAFMLLARDFCRNGAENDIYKLVDKIYKFTSNMPYPEQFIRAGAAEYLLKNGIRDSVWYRNVPLEEEEAEQTEIFVRKVLSPYASALAEITLKFSDELAAAKKKRSVMSFADIEQLAYRLLAENEDIRLEQQNRYDEILIDEYQDTNAMQDGIFEMLTNGTNLFMVGDMKQSIYRFRGSEPLVFRSKADTYLADSKAAERKISLTENFRSRAQVLSSVNDVFERCMSREVGELEYDSDQQLNAGNEGYQKTGCDYQSEYVLIERNASEDAPDRAELEAEYIARRIADMKRNGFMVRDKIKEEKDGKVQLADGVRKVRNSDFAVLMSSHKAESKTFREVFARYGIDCCCETDGYFVRPEIKLMMSLLRVIENPQRDIPFVAVMRSGVGGFTDDEIAKIRIHENKKSFCDALFSVYSKYLTLKDEGRLTPASEMFGAKVAAFAEKLISWRDKARYMSAEGMVHMLCEQAGLYAFFGAADGEEAQANLQLFFDRAKQYESSGFRGLFGFLRHMEKLEAGSEDLPGAEFSDGGDFVRIMTIHKSKGLEIPVVFLAGCGKSFNTEDIKGALLLHKELGFSINYNSYDENISIVSPVHEVFKKAIREELLSEEMRKLYVALTRAKEKLIATACIKNDKTLAGKLEMWSTLKGTELREKAAEAKSFNDWLAPVAMQSDNWKYEYVSDCEFEEQVTFSEEFSLEEYKLPDIERAKQILSYEYPYAAQRLKSKAAVSDFKGIAHDVLPAKPDFMTENSAGFGAEFGTAVHLIMETLPREHGRNREYVERHINALAESGQIRAEILTAVNADKILNLYNSELGGRMIAAKEVHSESEFEIGVSASRLYDDDSLEGEQVLLQGVIDCWFEEDDGIVLVDYKTDSVREIEEIHQKYDIQVALYAEALEKITKKRVKDKFIYLFSRDSVIQC